MDSTAEILHLYISEKNIVWWRLPQNTFTVLFFETLTVTMSFNTPIFPPEIPYLFFLFRFMSKPWENKSSDIFFLNKKVFDIKILFLKFARRFRVHYRSNTIRWTTLNTKTYREKVYRKVSGKPTFPIDTV